MRSTHDLILLRHAKSAWDTPAPTDFERPLAKRGRRDAPRMGRWLLDQGLVPNRVLCSPALRARQTLEGANQALELAADCIHYAQTLYAASPATLGDRVAETPEAIGTLLVVAHNPGLDYLLLGLCDSPQRSANGKLMTTAAVAHIRVDGPWSEIGRSNCSLVHLVRPRELD